MAREQDYVKSTCVLWRDFKRRLLQSFWRNIMSSDHADIVGMCLVTAERKWVQFPIGKGSLFPITSQGYSRLYESPGQPAISRTLELSLTMDADTAWTCCLYTPMKKCIDWPWDLVLA